MKAAVFGCGPAGLIAAHGITNAAEEVGVGVELSIFSMKRKSPLYGAQYLHAPIPGVPTEEPRTIDYILRGSASEYRRKVYGGKWLGTVSPEDLQEVHQGWDIRATYDWLWNQYHWSINDCLLDPIEMQEILLAEDWGVVISSLPLDTICYGMHDFPFTSVIAAGDAPALGVDVGSTYRCVEDTVICNGEESPSWYRMSRIFDHTTVEWPQTVRQVPISSAAHVRKPLETDCKCWPSVIKVGRYGTWQKGVLSHEAYNTAYKAVESSR